VRAFAEAALILLLVPVAGGASEGAPGTEEGDGSPDARLFANLTIDASKRGPQISPGLFGQNGAVWMSMNDSVADLTNRSGATILRWPGGETTDYYDWEADGGRGRVYRDDGTYWSPVRNTSTFVDFCRKTSCTPMVSANAVIADPQKAARWAREFLNQTLPVKLWQVGNEPVFDKHWNVSLPSFKTTDNFQPTTEDWAWVTREYAKALKAVDPEIEIIGPDGGAAEGSRDDVWVGEYVKKAWDAIDYVDIHSYPANGMNEADMLATPDSGPDGGLVNRIRMAKAMIAGNGSGKPLPLTMTEYNSDWNNGALMGSWVNGLFIADMLLHLAEENVTIANMWNLASQNEGYIDPSGVPRSSWHAFKLVREQFSGTVVETVSDAVANGYGLEAYAALRADGSLAIAVINKKSAASYDTTISLAGFKPDSSASVLLLDRQHNATREPAAPVSGSTISYRFLPYSLTILMVNTSQPPPLFVSATASPSAGQAPLTVQFNSSVSGAQGVVTWDWKFGDGGASTAQYPSYTYQFPGAFEAIVSVKDGAGRSAADNITISVASPPPPLFVSLSANPSSGVEPLTVHFNATATGAIGQVRFTWDFGDGGSGAGPSVKHVYLKNGVYSVAVTGTDSASRSSSDSVEIQVMIREDFPPPAPTELMGQCTNGAVELTWKHVVPDKVTFNVYRQNGSSWEKLNPAPVNATGYRDSLVNAGNAYTYRVTALYSTARESAPSKTVTVSVPATSGPEPGPAFNPFLAGTAIAALVVVGVAVAAVYARRQRRRNDLYAGHNRAP
jgi:PKD repeat protein